MNKERDLMAYLDDSYILEAEPKEAPRKGARHFRFTAAAAAAAACVGLTAVTAGAVVIYRSSSTSTSTVYESRAEEILESQGLILDEQVGGEHFDVSLDTVLADDYIYRIMLTAAPKDDIGRSYVSQYGTPEKALDGVNLIITNTEGESAPFGTRYARVSEDGSFVIIVNGHFDDLFRLTCPDGKLNVKVNGDMFGNASFTVKPEKNLESRIATTANGTKIHVSPIGAELVYESEEAQDFRALGFLWKEGGRERFLESLGITPEQDAANSAVTKWIDFRYLMAGKFFGKDNYGVGGGGVGFWENGDYYEDLGYTGSGTYVQTVDFGCIVDLDDTTGVVYGLEELPYDSQP